MCCTAGAILDMLVYGLPCCLIGMGLLRLLAASGFLSSIVLYGCSWWFGCFWLVHFSECCLCRLSGISIVTVICSVVVLSDVAAFLELLVPDDCCSGAPLWLTIADCRWVLGLLLVEVAGTGLPVAAAAFDGVGQGEATASACAEVDSGLGFLLGNIVLQ
ncbi:hypothetical protein Nepgr_033934 [Nepenthes gracilis]|uniref:Uncharacterized protein n=1 Tax=Nepenthes gracilis TaxID=150966 RepID=A0AAD3TLB1_NEPGR|nr:hypothetical protein Nepgr_033934 [Nepenthes gracilis]